jgi:hypothetical protein
MVCAQGMLAQAPRFPHGRPETLEKHLPRGIPRRDLGSEDRRPPDAQENGEAEDGTKAQSPSRGADGGLDIRRHGHPYHLAHWRLRTSTMRGSRYV